MFRKLLFGALISACMGAAAVIPASAQGTSNVTISGSMEGAIVIHNGDHVSAGYTFSIQGSHPAMTVNMADASVVISGPCSNGGSDTVTIPLSPGPYNIPANDNSNYPPGSGDESSPASYQGSVVANVCGGSGTLDASKGATFGADLQSNVTTNEVNVQFHYRDPAAKGNGNYDCTAGNYGSNVCGASWSGTAHVTPSSCSSGGSGSGSSCTTTSTSTTTTSSTTTSSTTTTPPPATTTTTTTSTSSPPVKAVKTQRKPKVCAKGKVKKTKKVHGKKIVVCVKRKISHKPKRVTGFTG